MGWMGWGGEALLLFYDTLWAWGECIALVSYNDSNFWCSGANLAYLMISRRLCVAVSISDEDNYSFLVGLVFSVTEADFLFFR